MSKEDGLEELLKSAYRHTESELGLEHVGHLSDQNSGLFRRPMTLFMNL